MSNEEIIFNERLRLAAEGRIPVTDRTVAVTDENGNVRQTRLPVEIFTYQAWKERGFQVRKGEKAVAGIRIWKPKRRKSGEDGEPEEKTQSETEFFSKKAWFFAPSQVDPIAEGGKP